jgi:hypothetical protein
MMAAIERGEIRIVDLKPKVKRVDAIQSFVSRETPSCGSSTPMARPALPIAIRSIYSDMHNYRLGLGASAGRPRAEGPRKPPSLHLKSHTDAPRSSQAEIQATRDGLASTLSGRRAANRRRKSGGLWRLSRAGFGSEAKATQTMPSASAREIVGKRQVARLPRLPSRGRWRTPKRSRRRPAVSATIQAFPIARPQLASPFLLCHAANFLDKLSCVTTRACNLSG